MEKKRLFLNFQKHRCIGNRNTLVKALYNRVFDYLIEKMNDRLSVKQEKFSSIGLLDIFGF
jgi:myosin heavy subunit